MYNQKKYYNVFAFVILCAELFSKVSLKNADYKK